MLASLTVRPAGGQRGSSSALNLEMNAALRSARAAGGLGGSGTSRLDALAEALAGSPGKGDGLEVGALAEGPQPDGLEAGGREISERGDASRIEGVVPELPSARELLTRFGAHVPCRASCLFTIYIHTCQYMMFLK